MDSAIDVVVVVSAASEVLEADSVGGGVVVVDAKDKDSVLWEMGRVVVVKADSVSADISADDEDDTGV